MARNISTIRTAVLYSAYGNRASYYDDWLEAFGEADAFEGLPFNIFQSSSRKRLSKLVGEFDLIVLLHSVTADNLIYAKQILPILQSRKCCLLSFVGNELNLPGAPMAPKIRFLKDAAVDVVATQLRKETGDFLYGDTGARIEGIPHALNQKSFFVRKNQNMRPIDIGIRSFRYPAVFIGDNDRNRLIDLFEENSFPSSLSIDISTRTRFNRDDWAKFLNNCKGTVSNEAGSQWVEKDDQTVNLIKNWLKSQRRDGTITIRADSPLRQLFHKLPWAVRHWLVGVLRGGPIQHEALIGKESDFDEVFDFAFSGKPILPEADGKCISSRHFDAIGTQTCQIMIEGRFNDILRANEHYIPIKRDLSDANDAIAKLLDDSFRQTMVECAYECVLAAHTYKHRLHQIEKIVTSL